jgi:hypothetical protein
LNVLRNQKPILGACEHDPLSLCQTQYSDTDYLLHEPPPPATSVVDGAIELFARLLPLQGLTATIKIIMQLRESVRLPKLEKNAGRKSAVFMFLIFHPFQLHQAQTIKNNIFPCVDVSIYIILEIDMVQYP